MVGLCSWGVLCEIMDTLVCVGCLQMYAAVGGCFQHFLFVVL